MTASPTFEYDVVLDCEGCDGAGYIEDPPVQDRNGPYFPTRCCPACGGAGTYTVHRRPIDFEDLATIAEDDPYSAFAYRGGNP